jgi:hypothetical protein
VKIAFWAIVVLWAGSTLFRYAWVVTEGGPECTSSSEGWKDCDWAPGATAFWGFFLILFALLLLFSARSLIQSIVEANISWSAGRIIWQAALVLGVLAALASLGQLMPQLGGEGVCFASNPNGPISMDGGRFEYAECEGSAWWETALPFLGLVASLGGAAVSFLRLRNNHRLVGP